MNIKVGDVVSLKSTGGPEMTVFRIIGEGEENISTKTQDTAYKMAGYGKGDVICQWFNANKVETSAFKAEMLKKFQAEK